MDERDYSLYIQLLSNIHARRVSGLPQDPASLLNFQSHFQKNSSPKFRSKFLIALCIISCLLMFLSQRIIPGFSTRVITGVSNYPNPFDPREGPTTITYCLAEDAPVTIIIYDLMGHLVQIFKVDAGANGGREGEDNKVPWDGTNQAGNLVARGGYLCRIMVEAEEGMFQCIRKIGVYSQ